MKRNNFFSRFITVTLTVALLLTMGSRAIRVSALAELAPVVAPVFDTQIYQLADYVEQNVPEESLDVFFFITGALAVAQMGAQDALLRDPYANSSDVVDWLKSCGIQLYNTVIGLVPEGDYYLQTVDGTITTKGIPRDMLKYLVAQMMGNAVVAANYPSLDAYLADENANTTVPLTKELQLGVNAVFGLNGGLYDWQMSTQAWPNLTFTQGTMSGAQNDVYLGYASQLVHPNIMYNAPYGTNGSIISDNVGESYLFFNTSTGKAYICDEYGNARTTRSLNCVFCTSNGTPTRSTWSLYFNSLNFASDTRPYRQIVIDYFTRNSSTSSALAHLEGPMSYYPLYNLFVKDAYYGSDWQSRALIENNTDLNVLPNLEPYYDQVENDYILDIRGLITDLVNYVYVRQPVFNNLYDEDGNLVVPILLHISTQLDDIINIINPALPVNLNDIDIYTNNTYMDLVKQRATTAGNTLAELVAFWHNCDAELIYVLFGAGLTVLVGAFIGKWGHS